MEIPDRLWRYSTKDALDQLASWFGFEFTDGMQDPEVEWADAGRIDEFLAAYEQRTLSDDERFALMELLLNSFEFADEPLASLPQWPRTLALLEQHIATHICSVLTYAAPADSADGWKIGPDLWAIAERHAAAFGYRLS